MRFLALFLWLAIAPAAWSQAAGAGVEPRADLIEDCISNATDAAGLSALETACPGLTQALDDSGYLLLLPIDQRDLLSSYQLEELHRVQSHYAQPPGEHSIDVDTLRPILDELHTQQPQQPLTWFQRFKQWLRSILEQQSPQSDSWLSRWLDEIEISAALTRTLIFGCVLLVIGLALAVVINELRVAGVLRRRRGADEAAAPARAAGFAHEDEGADIEAAARGNVPALLRVLVSTLVRSGRLHTERSLTHRELWKQAALTDAQQRDSFRRLAELAERTVYGVSTIPAQEAQPIIAEALALNLQLSGGAA